MLDTLIDNATANTKILNKLVADIPQEKMCVQFPSLPNHPAWQIGHLTQVRAFASAMLGKSANLPAEWPTKFGRNSTPVADPASYPSKESLLALFQLTHDHLIQIIRTIEVAALDVPHDIERLIPLFPTRRHLLFNMLTTHDGMHFGQISDFRRALGLPRVI